jgi:hypothetical protein
VSLGASCRFLESSVSGQTGRNPIALTHDDDLSLVVIDDGLTFDVGIEAEVCAGGKKVPFEQTPSLQL